MESINALDVLRSLKEGLGQHPSISAEDRERYLNFISAARKEYDEMAKKEVQKRLYTLMRSRRNADGQLS
ncbi:hypothetical protein PO124_30835 [Bacillus licheniformis]|nr:hypothetical protein [Bacillus licheniformis]